MNLRAAHPIHVGLFFIATALALPPLISPRGFEFLTAHMEGVGAILIALASLALIRLPTGWRDPGTLGLSIFGLAGVTLLQSRVGILPVNGTTLGLVLMLGVFACAAWIAQDVGRAIPDAWRRQTFVWLAGAMAISAVINAFAGLYQHFNGTFLSGWIPPAAAVDARVSGMTGQATFYALHLTWGLLSLTYLSLTVFAQRGRAAWIALWTALDLMLLYALSFGGSRSTLVFLGLCAVMAWGFAALDKQRDVARPLARIASGWVLAYLLLSWMAPTTSSSLYRLVDPGTSLSRFDLLWLGVDQWRAGDFWLGGGWSTFSLFVFEQGGELARSTIEVWTNPHNVFTAILGQAGVLGVLCLLLPLILWWRRVRIQSSESLFALLMIAVVVAQCMWEFPVWYLVVLLPLAFLFGFIEQAPPQEARDRPTTPARMIWRFALVIAVIAAAISLIQANGRYTTAVYRQADLSEIIGESTLLSRPVVIERLASIMDVTAVSETRLRIMDEAAHFYAASEVMYRYALLLAGRDAPGDMERARRYLGTLRAQSEDNYQLWRTAVMTNEVFASQRKLFDLSD